MRPAIPSLVSRQIDMEFYMYANSMQNVTSSGLLIYSVKGEQFPGKEPIAVDLHEYVASL